MLAIYACDNSLLVHKQLPLKSIPENIVTLHTVFQSYSNYSHLFQFIHNEIPLVASDGGPAGFLFPVQLLHHSLVILPTWLAIPRLPTTCKVIKEIRCWCYQEFSAHTSIYPFVVRTTLPFTPCPSAIYHRHTDLKALVVQIQSSC